MIMTRPWGWGLRVCSWRERPGGETWSESQPGGTYNIHVIGHNNENCRDGFCFGIEWTSSQAAPFGKTSSQLTRTVDKSIRSVSGAPLHVHDSVLKLIIVSDVQVIDTHERIDVGLPTERIGTAHQVGEDHQDQQLCHCHHIFYF